MKTRKKILYALMTAAVSMLYLMVPGCGNQSSNATVPYGGYGYGNTVCIPGQICQNGLSGYGSGTALVPGIVMASIDNNGSMVQMQFGGTSVVAGSQYSGPMTVTGVIQMAPGGVCPPGAYQFQGQGQWANGTGIPTAQATLQITGTGGTMQGQINGNVFTGQDQYAPQMQSQFYFRGQFQTSCNPGGVAL